MLLLALAAVLVAGFTAVGAAVTRRARGTGRRP